MTKLLHFEDFRAGQVYDLGTHLLSAEEIIEFASEFDPQPQHTNPNAAKDLLGGLAASGWHLCAVAMRMMVDGLFIRATSLGAPGVDEVQWRKPVRAGETVILDGEVLDTRPSSNPGRGFVRFRFTMRREKPDGRREPVMFFVCSVMFGRASASSA
ncbi:MAG TPA: MaoC family dehydratase [Micropepsaceae bacterium]|jgi:acyl dehydratase|nr:MaoC family dehydratase [Micropepsaceae bacterium]